MAIGINDFRKRFQGTRPNRFIIELGLPDVVGGNPIDMDLYGKATQLPTASMGVIPVPWMGRVVKFSGERTFADWTVQMYDANEDNSKDVRYLMMQWMEAMDSADEHNINYNVTSNAKIRWNDFGGGQEAVHNDQTGFFREVTLYGVFPIDVGPLELSYDVTDTFSEFAVTFAYDYWNYTS